MGNERAERERMREKERYGYVYFWLMVSRKRCDRRYCVFYQVFKFVFKRQMHYPILRDISYINGEIRTNLYPNSTRHYTLLRERKSREFFPFENIPRVPSPFFFLPFVLDFADSYLTAVHANIIFFTRIVE